MECNEVAKSAKCRNIRLCQRICPKKWLRALALVGVFASMIAVILLGSTTIPSLLTISPSNAPLVTPNAHFSVLRLKCDVRQRSKQSRRCPKCSPHVPYTTKSSRKTCINAGMYSPKISTIVHWKVAGAFFRPNIITVAANTPQSVTNAFFSWLSGCIRT